MENFHFLSLNLKLNLGPRACKASALNCIPGPIFHPSRTIYKKRAKRNLLFRDQLCKDSSSIKKASGTLIHSDSTANCPSVTEGDSRHREIAPSILQAPRDSERGCCQSEASSAVRTLPQSFPLSSPPLPWLAEEYSPFYFFLQNLGSS